VIWHARNNKIFNNVTSGVDELVEEVSLTSLRFPLVCFTNGAGIRRIVFVGRTRRGCTIFGFYVRVLLCISSGVSFSLCAGVQTTLGGGGLISLFWFKALWYALVFCDVLRPLEVL